MASAGAGPTKAGGSVSGMLDRLGRRLLRRRLRGCEQGQELVEFALLAPVLLILLMGTVEAGRALGSEHRLSVISREAKPPPPRT